MMAGRIWFCFFVLSLQVGSSGSFKEINHFYWLPGEDLSIIGYSLSPGPRRIFCRENCQGENVLINTTSNKATSGRNSIEYSERVHDKSYNLTMRVSNLAHSDSGLYRYGLTDSPFLPNNRFKVVVAEAVLDGSKDHHLYKEAGSSLTVACSFGFSGQTKHFCRGECEEEENILVYTDGVRAQSGRYSIGYSFFRSSAVFYVTIKNLTQSDSGRYRCLSSLSSGKKPYLDFSVFVSDVGNNRTLEEVNYHYRLPGEELSITCNNPSPGARRIFCRENCQGENVLINTTSNKATSGRNRIEYSERVNDKSYNLMVIVSNLTLSDSGLYRCGLTDSPTTFVKFKAVVAEAVLDGSKDHHLYKEAGSSLTVACSFGSSGQTKYFCRGECEEEENILVYTNGVRAQSGRYSIGHDRDKSSNVFYVTIKNLTQSDSGRYRCLSYSSSGKNSHVDFNITVTYVSSETTDPSALDQNYRATSTDLPLIVIVVTLAVIVVLLSAALIVSYRKRSLRDLEIIGSSGQEMESVACDRTTSGDLIYQNISPLSSNQK